MAATEAAMHGLLFQEVFVPVSLVVAALRQNCQNEQIRIREQPLICFCASSFRGARDESKVAAAGEVAKVIETDSRQPRNLIFCEELLARFNRQHGAPLSYYDAKCIVEAALIPLQ